MTLLLKDARHALRTFRANPGFTGTVIATLVIGIGANAAIFSLVNAVLLEPVPFPEPERLVFVRTSSDGVPANPMASPPKFMHWRAQTDVLEDVAAFRNTPMTYAAGEVPEQVTAATVSLAYFRLFRAPIVQGRGFTAEEDLPNGPRAVMLSHEFWTERLGGEAEVVGESLTLNGQPHTIVGIVGPGFDMREFGRPEVWVPFQLDPNSTEQSHFFRVAARLEPGVSLEQAQARLEASAAEFRETYPTALQPNDGFSVIRMRDALAGNAASMLVLLVGAVAFVLMIACANVANLLLARATGRRREMAIRSSLGAGRWRIMRQLLTESVMLSAVGGALGLFAGYIGMRALLAVNTGNLPRLGEAGALLGLDWRVVTFTLALSLLTGVIFGLAPALTASRTDPSAALKDSGSRGAGGGLWQSKMRSALVALELGLAVVLLIGAALMIRTMLTLGQVDPGFATDNVVTMRTALTEPRFAATSAVERAARNALERIRSMPGVEHAAATCCVPLHPSVGVVSMPFDVVGRENEGPFTGGGLVVVTTPGYFSTFEIPIVRGRAIRRDDDGAAPPVVVISQAMADQYWSDGADPLQDRIRLGGGGAVNIPGLAEEPVRQIVGVVGDTRTTGLANDPGPMMYVPQAQLPDALNERLLGLTGMAWVVRTSGGSGTLSASIQQAIRQAMDVAVTDVRSMEEIVSLGTSRRGFGALLISAFGGSALLLAVIGVYGLMSYSVQQRTQEFGIRLALGSEPHRLRNVVIGQGMVLGALGIAAGLIAAFYLVNPLAAGLYGVDRHDPLVFAAVPIVLAVVSFAAVAIPSQRAVAMRPMDALRHE